MLIRTGTPSQTGSAPATVHVATPAKVNLFLEILGKRADNKHELNTFMLAVTLHDELAFSLPQTGSEIALSIDVPELTSGPDNLIVKAARLLQERTGGAFGAEIRLTKRIPWAAGLGGGSADAAATLAGLNVLWNLNLERAALMALGAELGSDIPFFLSGASAAWCTGRGEIITPFPLTHTWHMLLVKPPEGISTAAAYRGVRVPADPVPDTQLRAALARGSLPELGAALHNRLQEAAFALSPTTAALFARLQRTNAVGCLMSGSGSCLVALVPSPSEAQQIADDLLRESAPDIPPGTRTYIVQSCTETLPTA